MESVAPMRHWLHMHFVGLGMLLVLAHWAYYYGAVIFYLTRCALRSLLSTAGLAL